MWLLSTDRAELHYFANNFDATGGYAILSHTWDKSGEQTLQEVRAIGKRCKARGANPRDDRKLSPKIRNCCIRAEKYGYRWVWIDSCCIDKTSSSELSEAINSMFRWYKEAEVCFAYLADVPTYCDLTVNDSTFRKSRWHTRGWTLQELIAPDFLIFLSADWRELANRADLADLLEEITQVPVGVSIGEVAPAQYSVSVRMSWASRRKTTRVEDEAYCLIGLFGVSMPTNYGEGKKAFIRLQHEIMQHNPDMSLFAFGYQVDQNHSLTFYPQERVNGSWQFLMTDSPREHTFGVVYIPDLHTQGEKQQYPPPQGSRLTGPFEGGVELPRVMVTSYGVELRLPIYEANGITLAVMLCCGPNGHHLGLFLTRDSQGRDPTRPRYFTGCVVTKPDTGPARYNARMADLGDDLYNLTFNGMPVKASWRTIYVVLTASNLDSRSSTTPNLIMNCNPASRFRIPRWLIARLTALQFEVDEVHNTETLRVLEIFLNGAARIYVSLGSCQRNRRHTDETPPLWAKVDVLVDHDQLTTFTHDCEKDHIGSKSWATRSKGFGDADRAVVLSLTPSTWMPEGFFTIHLQLSGRVLEGMLQDAGALSMLPPLTDLQRNAPLRSALNHSGESFRSHASQAPSTDSTKVRKTLAQLILHPFTQRKTYPAHSQLQAGPQSTSSLALTP